MFGDIGNLGPGKTTGTDDGLAESSGAATTKKRLLLIEDEPLTRLVLLNEFRMAGIEVDPASSGRNALVKLRRGYPDAIFLGLPLPDIDGIQLIKEIRRDPQYKSRPIYVCDSAFPPGNRSRKAMQAGATKVFDKLATPMHVILTDVLAHLAGKDLSDQLSSLTATPAGKANVSNEHFGKLDESLQRLAKCKDNQARIVECGILHGLVQTIVQQ